MARRRKPVPRRQGRGNVQPCRRGFKARPENFIYTGTIDVCEFNRGVPFDEIKLDPKPKPTAYERPKQEADRIVAGTLDKGLPAREALAQMMKNPPLIAKGQLHFLSMEVRPSAERVRTELGWSPFSFEEGPAATIEDFGRRGWIKTA